MYTFGILLIIMVCLYFVMDKKLISTVNKLDLNAILSNIRKQSLAHFLKQNLSDAHRNRT
jgi:hypothetical protein